MNRAKRIKLDSDVSHDELPDPVQQEQHKSPLSTIKQPAKFKTPSPHSTKLFWRVGYKLLHGNFLRLMSGGKSERQGLHEGYSNLDPQKSTINFAVPDVKVIREFNAWSYLENIPKEISPGILFSY